MGLVVREEIARWEDRLVRLAQAKTVIEARAAAEQVDHEEKMGHHEEQERTTGRCPPTPPLPGAHSGDQYNFSDPGRAS
jgi:hypothetical protein